MRTLFRFLLLALVFYGLVLAQTPSLQFTQSFTTATTGTVQGNGPTTTGGFQGSVGFRMVYYIQPGSGTVTALSVELDGAATSGGTYTALTPSPAGGSGGTPSVNPAVTFPQGQNNLCCDFYPFLKIKVNTMTVSGGTPILIVKVMGYAGTSAASSGGGAAPVGPCGGDLGGFFPNCTVLGLTNVNNAHSIPVNVYAPRIGVNGDELLLNVQGSDIPVRIAVHNDGAIPQEISLSAGLHSDTPGDQPAIDGHRSRGTESAKTAVAAGDSLLTIAGLGYDGATYQIPWAIISSVGGPVSAGVVPGLVQFLNTDTGGSLGVPIQLNPDLAHSVTLGGSGTTGGGVQCLQVDNGGTVSGSGGPCPVATSNVRSFGGSFDGGGAALTAGKTTYVTVPYACTISAWNILVDAGTATVDIWRKPTGTAIPTAGDTITAAAVPAISAGTAVHSTVTTGWCGTGTCAIAQNDIIGINLKATATATFVNMVVQCDQ